MSSEDSTRVYRSVLEVYFNLRRTEFIEFFGIYANTTFNEEIYHKVLRCTIQGRKISQNKNFEVSKFDRETLKFLAELTIYCCDDLSNPEAWLQELYPGITFNELLECVFRDFAISTNRNNPKFIELRSYGLATLDLPEGPREKEISELHGPFTILRNGKLVYLPRRVFTKDSGDTPVIGNDQDIPAEQGTDDERTKELKKSSSLKFLAERPLTYEDLTEAHYQSLKRLDEIASESFAREMKEVYDLVTHPDFQDAVKELISFILEGSYLNQIAKMFPHTKDIDKNNESNAQYHRSRINEIIYALNYQTRFQELKSLHALIDTSTLLYGAIFLSLQIMYYFQISLKLEPNTNLLKTYGKLRDAELLNTLQQFNIQNRFPEFLTHDVIAHTRNDLSFSLNYKFNSEPKDFNIIPINLKETDLNHFKIILKTISKPEFLIIPFKCKYIRVLFRRISNLGVKMDGQSDFSFDRAGVSVPEKVDVQKLSSLIQYLKVTRDDEINKGYESDIDMVIIALEKYLNSANSEDIKSGMLYLLDLCSKQATLIKKYAGEFKPIENDNLTINLLSTFKINRD